MGDHDGDRPRLRDAAPEVVGSAAALLVQSVLRDEATGSVLAPLFATVIRVGQARERQWWERSVRALEVAAAEADVSLEELERRATNDAARTELFIRVVEASGRTPLEAKVPALGLVLARGLDPEGRVDLAFIYTGALNDLEAPHVEVLGLLEAEPCGPAFAVSEHERGWYPTELARRLPTHADAMPSVLRTLDRHALVLDPVPGSWPSDEGGEHPVALSELGRGCLELLRTPRVAV